METRAPVYLDYNASALVRPEVQALEEAALLLFRRAGKLVHTGAVEVVRHFVQRAQVDVHGTGIEGHGTAVGDDARAIRVIDQLADFRQAPAQRTPGIVGDFPQQFAQLLPALGFFREGEVGQQRACLARGWKFEHLAAPNLDRTDLGDHAAGCR